MLETKLFVPRARPGQVPRPGLVERLDRGSGATLTLVSAPAGFGKTTLVTAWLASTAAGADDRRVAWLSLDRKDSDPTTFWSYVVAAVQTAVPDIGGDQLALLRSPNPPPLESVLTTLLNDLGAFPGRLVLVLDDYHVVDAREVQESMAFLVEHAPPQLQVVLATRADPALPLARLRARGDLVEIRAADLRFTDEEVAQYLNDVMGLALGPELLTALAERTEGWVAALQLAALSMQGREDVAGFIAGFAGDDRYVVDYLVEEVVQRQPQHVRDFLLQTSVLGRLNGPLCDAVTDREGSRAMLQALERDNLFLVPLDDRRQWYRYHHLFADVLQTRLMEEHPGQLRELHARASTWFEENDELLVAFEHALASGDADRAGHLVELVLPALRKDRRESTLCELLDALPAEVIESRPVLSLGYVGGLLSVGAVDRVAPYLKNAERWVRATAQSDGRPDGRPDGMVVTDEVELRRLPAWISIYHAGLALLTGDPAATVSHAQHALRQLEEGDDLGLGAASALVGLATWSMGDLESAHWAYVDCLVPFERMGHVADVLGCTVTVGDLRVARGRLRDATRAYEHALGLVPEAGPVVRGTADMYVGLSALHYERNDLSAARRLLTRSEELGEHLGLPQNAYRSRVVLARILQAEGDVDGAITLFDEAERVHDTDFSPDVQPVPALRARVRIASGDWEAGDAWAREHGLSTDDELSYVREFEHITLAWTHLARFTATRDRRSLDEATGLLQRLLSAAEAGERKGSVLEILVLLALAHESADDESAAIESLGRALALAEPEGYVRTFVDHGAPMARLLATAARQGVSSDYARRLLVALEPARGAAPAQRLIDPLSDRELDVLRLLSSELSGPEIARELVVSVNTVRTHTKSIYAKLGVNSRRAAVRRSSELDLL